MEPLIRRWGCTDPSLVADTPTSRVWRVRRAGGTAIVKDLNPIGVEDELRGADLLAWRGGHGAVRLLDREGSTLLLEDAGPTSLLDRFGELGDEASTKVILDVLEALHASGPAVRPTALQPLGERFASLFALADAGVEPLILEGAKIARRLLGDRRDVRPLHGDIHYGNVHASDRGWLAIDPKGLVGDAAYDVANLFYNPLDRQDLRTDLGRIRSIATAFGVRFHRDPADVLAWAFADMCLNASWHLEEGNVPRATSDLEIAAAIRAVLATVHSAP